jgi:hypothetical protein
VAQSLGFIVLDLDQVWLIGGCYVLSIRLRAADLRRRRAGFYIF